MSRNLLMAALLSLLAVSAASASRADDAKGPPADTPFRHIVDTTLIKTHRTYVEPDKSIHPVAIVRDDKGVTSAFTEDELVIYDDPKEVDALVKTYGGRVVRNITVNMMSKEGKLLGPAKTRPATVIQIDTAALQLDVEVEGAKTRKFRGVHAFSSEKSAKLAALFLHEQSAGHAVVLNFLGENQEFPVSSKEQADVNGVSDAYQWPEFDHRAWQYVSQMPIQSVPVVAIIDGGFWLNSQGVPCGYAYDSLCQTTAGVVGSSDLPKFMIEGDATGGPGPAGGTSPVTCTGGASCPWHGDKSASVALGAISNGTGAAGMGGQVVVSPILIKSGAPFAETTASIQAAVQYGANIISISSGGSCNGWCQAFTSGNFEAPADAMAQGVLVVAAAGNDGQDAGSDNFFPCDNPPTLCVGAMNPNPGPGGYFGVISGFTAGYSNYGPFVLVYAPTNIHAMPDGGSAGQLTFHTGTSAATPYVTGVATLMKAINSSLTGMQLEQMIVSTAQPIVSTPYPSDQPQSGGFINPLAAVMAAAGGAPPAPHIVIAAPANNAVVGQAVYESVTFTASAFDLTTEYWPPSNGYNGTPTTPPPPTFSGRILWSSNIDGQMGEGPSIAYQFNPSAQTGKRVVTATATSARGKSTSASITVDYQPQIGGPRVAILYPPAGSTFSPGDIIVRGQATSAVSLGYVPCSNLIWQVGIARPAIASASIGGPESGLCQATVPFTNAGSETLKLTATDTTGKVGVAQETLNIEASATPKVSIDSPQPGQSYVNYPVYNQPVYIPLHAFVQNAPAGATLTYSWSWYPTASGPSAKAPIAVGQTQTFPTKLCGALTVEVDVTSPAIPTSTTVEAHRGVQINCSSTQ